MSLHTEDHTCNILCRMTVENFIRIVWTAFDNLTFSWKGREKKGTIAYEVENFS